MKPFYYFLIVLFCAVGCSKNDINSDEIYMYVDYKYKDSPSSLFNSKNLNVKIEGHSKDWYPLTNNTIEGFQYEEGYVYKLLVERSFIKHPPQDGSSHTYKLLKVIEKNKVE